jgi:hypothetical protein
MLSLREVRLPTIERRRVGQDVDAKFDRVERTSHAGWIDFALSTARSHWIAEKKTLSSRMAPLWP